MDAADIDPRRSTEQDGTAKPYEPPTITDLGSLIQGTAGTGRIQTQDTSGVSV